MARKPRQEEGGDSWMNTYADLVTLLLTFFVLLFSMSSVDAEKWENFVRAFANPGQDTMQIVIDSSQDLGDQLAAATGDMTPAHGDSMPRTDESLPASFDELFEYLQSYMAANDMGDSIQLSKGKNTVYIRFKNNLFFDPDSSVIRRTAYPVLDFLGDCLHAVEDEILTININGHTAAVQNGQNYQVSDWMLSSERASEIAIYFEENRQVEPTIMRPIGYGKNFPIASNDTSEGREANRRVDMVIVSKNASLNPDDPMYQEFVGLFDPSEFPTSASADSLLVPETVNGDGAADMDAQAAQQAALDAIASIGTSSVGGVSTEPAPAPAGETTQ